MSEPLAAGRDLYLTLDLTLQQAAERLLEGKVGAIVVLDPARGEILAMLSRPYLDSNSLDIHWDSYRRDPKYPFLPRATSGLYPPGSAVKPLVLAAALDLDVVSAAKTWDDTGTMSLGEDGQIRNPGGRVLGQIDAVQALALSSNVVFAELALLLGQDMLQYYQRFGLASVPSIGLRGQPGRVFGAVDNEASLAQAGIGQGDLLVTPLQMALAVGAIANRGVMMQPYLVREIHGPWLPQVWRPEAIASVVKAETAQLVTEAMVAAVEWGTARAAAVEGMAVAGKTGTAQNPHGEDHAWFVGFAPADAARACVVVVVEHGGSGGASAAPIAGEMLRILRDYPEG